MVKLEGKAIVITGAGRGIGAAYARAAAALGARVVVNDRDAAAAEEVAAGIRATGAAAVSHPCDVAQWEPARALVERCVQEFGAIDGLVNNAGVFRMERIHEMTEAACRMTLEVNVLGTMFPSAHAIGHMQRAGRGAIVNVTSGAQMGLVAMGAYGASKGAVASLTYAWAADLPAGTIRVNAVSPSGATQMGEHNVGYYRDRGQTIAPNPNTPEDNAPLVCYLLSDAAAGVHGQVVRIHGRKLALVSHPAVLEPVQEHPSAWTSDAIEEAFARVFCAHLQPVGLRHVRQSPA